MIVHDGHMTSEGDCIPEAKGVHSNKSSDPIHNVTKETWSGMVRVDWGGLRNLAEWGWSTCDKEGQL